MEDLIQTAAGFDHWLETALAVLAAVAIAIRRIRRALAMAFKTLKEPDNGN